MHYSLPGSQKEVMDCNTVACITVSAPVWAVLNDQDNRKLNNAPKYPTVGTAENIGTMELKWFLLKTYRNTEFTQAVARRMRNYSPSLRI